ncbi:hypothetical protein BMF94_0711 [Rhodotorula taiwanensis]|uniref:RlpA-like protein double-psi beta-barrel domain-containing protein n=1 Tax=Rhodotorula taiwanensis TaxID=741276 RepID=A0A2S5BHE7_9BASI|nr:hypothetical protein BMF94_0711 [Rhodotorula taiwanensis]
MPRGSRPVSAAPPLPRDQSATHDSSDDLDSVSHPVDRSATHPAVPVRASGGTSGEPGARRTAHAPAAATGQVKPSRKTRVDATKGTYAPVGDQAGASDSSDFDRSHPPSDGDLEVTPATPRSKRKQGKRALGGSDLEKSPGGEPESEGWSMTKRLVVGGLALFAVIVIAVVAFLMLHGSAASNASSATSSADSLASHANETASVASNSSSAASNSSTGVISGLGAPSADGVVTSPATSLPSEASMATSVQQPVQTGVVSPSVAIASTASIGAFGPIGGASSGSAHAAATATSAAGSPAEHGQPGLPSVASPTEPSLDLAPLQSQTVPSASILPAFDDGPLTAASGEANPAFPSGVATKTAKGVSAQVGTTKISTTATRFGASQHLSACHEVFDDGALVAAVHPALFGSDGSTPSELCDAKLHIWQPDSDQTITVSIQDVCSNCPTPTAIDLTQAAFLKLAPDRDTALDQGVLSVQWWFDDVALQQRLPIGFDQWARG